MMYGAIPRTTKQPLSPLNSKPNFISLFPKSSQYVNANPRTTRLFKSTTQFCSFTSSSSSSSLKPQFFTSSFQNTTKHQLQFRYRYYSTEQQPLFEEQLSTSLQTPSPSNVLVEPQSSIVSSVITEPVLTTTTTTTTTTTAATTTGGNEELSESALNDLLASFSAELGDQTLPLDIIPESHWYDWIQSSCIQVITTIHEVFGCPWYLSLALAGFIMRVVTFPLNLVSMRNSSILTEIRETITNVANQKSRLPEGATREQKMERQREIRNEISAISKERGVSQWKIFLPVLFQIPIMVAFYTSIRRMCNESTALTFGGAYWFADLTLPDPIFIFPMMSGLIFLSSAEVQRLINIRNGIPQTRLNKIITVVMRVVFVVMIPLTSLLPVGIHFYWLGTGIFSVFLPLLWRWPTFQRIFKLPKNAGLQGKPTIVVQETTVSAKPSKYRLGRSNTKI